MERLKAFLVMLFFVSLFMTEATTIFYYSSWFGDRPATYFMYIVIMYITCIVMLRSVVMYGRTFKKDNSNRMI